ncbi:hypothetical protein ACFRMO_08210 [Streptomyces anulatus]|uniref:hypothetical protein n=1 Tax=Streptomyces anulatus TaxID=1892 RepID=UPI0036ACC575
MSQRKPPSGLRVLIADQGWPEDEQPVQHRFQENRYRLGDFDDRDAAEMRAGRKLPIVAIVQEKNARGTRWVAVDHLWNFVGRVDMLGAFENPREIPDPVLRAFVADLWTAVFDLSVGQLVHRRASHRTWRVLDLESTPYEGDSHLLTGYVICAPEHGTGPAVRIPVEQLRKR